MERMRVHVASLSGPSEDGFRVAHVVALSGSQVHGRPAARVQLEVTLEAVAGEHHAVALQRAKDEALRYLDIL